MKVNYVSVIRKYARKSKNEKYIIKASMDANPPSIWFKQLQLYWITSPGLIKLCPEPLLEQNEIFVSIFNQEDILDTINSLINLINITKTSYVIPNNPIFLLKENIS